MDRYSDSIMVAFLPTTTDWCRQELPHMTLVYAGKVSDHSPGQFNELAKDASMIAMLAIPFVLKVQGLDVFGDEEKVDVLRLRSTPELLAMRRVVERWNKSEHPFNPHVTIGPVGPRVPDMPSVIGFDRILVTWGVDHLVFAL